MSMIRKTTITYCISTHGKVRKSRRTFTVARYSKANKSRATGALFFVKMYAKLERTQRNAFENKDQHKKPTNNGTINQQQQNHLLRTDSSLSHCGSLSSIYWRQIFVLDSVVSLNTKIFSSHGGFLTSAAYHHRVTI